MLRTGRVTIASLIKSWPGAPLLGRHPNQEDPITVRLDPIVWEGFLSSPPRDLCLLRVSQVICVSISGFSRLEMSAALRREGGREGVT
ncbi:hypothetical protein B296_00036147 [Ensete ventricosum]|uniref:Uncharacterized protein n=1 Tax=Ensete ventricosum TaxID=4639 RepID=A0A427A3R1_ENSVE|nr:hypothetical protein B296_00036147 [Ensete ventricosum]